jgi:probable aminopeptidase NPEPL1
MVGKGVIYDTGGLALKQREGMCGMKRDMGGAAGVLGGFRAAVKAGSARRLCALLCLVENVINERAVRNDDIITLYSGKTVEVNNTDAEGRLILADGVAYAVKHLQASTVLDMATLTGAQGIATGKNHAALYCSDEALEAAVLAAGRTCGDLSHPLPYAPEFYRAEFASAVADMKNSVADRSNAQSSCAGQFIGNHIAPWVEAGGSWCHIDMAYPAYVGERATGWGVALLYQLATTLRARE